MPQPPLVSIIIPCYRQGHFLSGAIECALRQTYANIEIIVVNDGSDDNTEEVASSYLPRIQYLAQSNKGLPGARNTGIAHAKGDYLHFLDADDLLHEDAISWLVEAVSGRDNVIGIVEFKVFEHEAEIPTRRSIHVEGKALLPNLLHRNFGPPHCYLVARSAVLKIGLFAQTLRSCEDWDLWLRLALSRVECSRVAKPGAYYRISPNSMSKNATRMLQTRSEVLARAHDVIVGNESLLGFLGSELLNAEYRVMRRCIAQGLDQDYIQMIGKRIPELESAGFREPPRSMKLKLRKHLGLFRSERLIMAFKRVLRPSEYAYFAHGYE